MPTYTVKVAKAADRQIDALDGSVRLRVIRAIQALKEEPRPRRLQEAESAVADPRWLISSRLRHSTTAS